MRKQKMNRQIPAGKCYFCNNTFSKTEMTRHLKLCKQVRVVHKAPPDKQKAKLFHLVVEGRYLPEYWMHLEAPADATLKNLDNFLRQTWLECCGHLSAFEIEGKNYVSVPAEELEFGEKGMNVALGKVLRTGMKFYHKYDFGTATELALRVVLEREGKIRGKRIQLLARNEPPLITCESCEKIATQVCSQCIYEGGGWFCDGCAGKHECGEEMLLPVVNSPRVGMCGYTGE